MWCVGSYQMLSGKFDILKVERDKKQEYLKVNLLKEDVSKLFYKFLVPAVSGAVAVAAYSLVDCIAIGQGVGANGAAANAVVLPIFSLASFIALVFGIGGCVLRSQARGEGNEEKGNAYFTAATVFISIISLLIWIFGMIFQEDFYRLCGADETLMPYVKAYGSLIFAFHPTFVFTTFLSGFIRADGSPKFVMGVMLFGGILNVIGDYVFVFPMQMGMAGAALATVLGSTAQAILLTGYILLRKTSLKFVMPHRWLPALKKIIMVGFGAGVGSLAVIIVTFIANNQIMKYSGTAALAIYGMLGTVAAVLISVFSGVGQAAQPIVSENYGAGNMERCWKTEKLGMKTAVILGVIFTGLCLVFPLQITALFMQLTAEIEEMAPYIVRIYGISFIALSVNTFVIYFLQSIACPKMATMVSLLRGIILNSIFLFVFPLVIGENGIWWAILLAEVFTMIAAVGCVMEEYRKYSV